MYHVYVRRKGDSEWLIFTEKPVGILTAERYCASIQRNYTGIEATKFGVAQ